MGKRKSAADVGSSQESKKSRPDALSMIVRPTEAPSTIVGQINIPSVAISSAAKEAVITLVSPAAFPSTRAPSDVVRPSVQEPDDDDVVVIEAPIASIKLVICQVPLMPDSRSVG